jgi:hypothetical protein
MSDFFIRSLGSVVNILAVLGAIGVVIAALAAGFSQEPIEMSGGVIGGLLNVTGGLLAFFVVLLAGLVFLTLLAGLIYLVLGIYENTKKTAEAVERLHSRS